METKDKKESENQVEEQTEVFLEWKGRKFKNADEAKGFLDALAFSQGRNAQEADAAKKELEPFRKYNLKKVSVDEAGLLQKVDALHEEGRHTEATKLLLEYNNQIKQDLQVQREEDRLWSDYVKARPDVFDVLPEDMARDHVFSNYRDTLQDTDDPVQLLDSILKPKASRLKPTKESDEPAITLSAGNAPAPAPKAKPEEEEKSNVMEETLKRMGF